MSEHERPDPRHRPPDPAGTRPKVDPDSLLPEPVEAPVEGEAFEEGASELRILPPGEGEVLPQVREPAPAPAVAIPRETKHTPRFQFLLGALLAVGAVALAAAVAIALRPDQATTSRQVAWSPWQPRPGGDALFDIVDHVAKEYRLPGRGNDQLVLVQPQPLELKNGELAQLAVEQPGAAGVDKVLLPGTPIAYRFCGLGKTCALPGKPSAGRLTLLRREALELALYTLRYIDPVDEVVVFLPPVIDEITKKPERVTLLFQRQQLTPLLLRPLYSTLARRTPTAAGADTSPDADVVKRLTTPYTPRITQSTSDPGGGPPFLVLAPVTAKKPVLPGGSKPANALEELTQQRPLRRQP